MSKRRHHFGCRGKSCYFTAFSFHCFFDLGRRTRLRRVFTFCAIRFVCSLGRLTFQRFYCRLLGFHGLQRFRLLVTRSTRHILFPRFTSGIGFRTRRSSVRLTFARTTLVGRIIGWRFLRRLGGVFNWLAFVTA